jgi:outer membrane protein assembly factor BamB
VRRRTLVAVAVLFCALGGVAVAGFVADDGRGADVRVTWVSETARESSGNHHAPAATGAHGGAVYAPVSGLTGTDGCALVALDAATGAERWRHRIPPPDCTIHSVADPTVADYDADGTAEVLAATTETELVAYDPESRAVELEYDLASYGYTRPVVADVAGDDRPEIVVVDVRGTVSVVRANGTTVWRRRLDSTINGQPRVADFDGDGSPEVAVGTGSPGRLSLFESDGTQTWDAPASIGGSITWLTTGQADGDAAPELVAATASDGVVAMVDGDGTVDWTRDLGSFAAVHAVVDGDGDGSAEVYATARDGTLHSLDAGTGTTEWVTTLTTADVQMMPPPAAGDVDGDGRLELVAPTNDGRVSLVDAESGAVVSTYERDDAIYTHPTLADVDGDGDVEAFVIYSRGRVVAFDVA